MMRIAVVGAGALGQYYGALLQKSGLEVNFVMRRDYSAVVESGLRVFSVNGDFYLPKVNAYCKSGDIGHVDLVIVGLKTFANDQFNEMIAPLLGERTMILTLQNGLGNEDLLAGLFGRERIVGGVAFLCANRGEPGVVHHLGAGRIVLGEYERHDRKRLDQLVDMFMNAGVDCRATDDLLRARWEKLVWNIPFNGLCALLNQPVNELLCVVATRQLVKDLMLEVIEAANAQELQKPLSTDFAQSMLEFTDNMGLYKPSMQIDREEGRELEIGSIFRMPLSYAARSGVPMPRVEMLAALLEQVRICKEITATV